MTATTAAETVEDFALELRELRMAAGDPTLAALSARTGVSKSVISEAFMGRRLPTERTVTKLVAALGGDRDEWIRRRRALDSRAAVTPIASDAEKRSQRTRGFSLLQTVLIAAGAAILSAIGTGALLMSSGLAPTSEPPSADQVSYVVHENGVDPMLTKCREDSVIAASEVRLDNEVQVQLMYSNQCMAVWGRVTRYDGQSAEGALSMRIYPKDAPDSGRAQERIGEGLQSIYTPMLIEPDVEARVCGLATVTVEGETIELGPPICA